MTCYPGANIEEHFGPTATPARSWYATQGPRGCCNEVTVHRFPSRKARDRWVAALGARACSAPEARRIIDRRADVGMPAYRGMENHANCRPGGCACQPDAD